MRAKALLLIISVLMILGHRVGLGQEQSTPAAPPNNNGQKELDKQLKIYKSTLLEGKTEQIRVDAATVLLASDNPQARQILIEALQQSTPSTGRVAVCKALILARTSRQELKNAQQFIGPLLQVLASSDETTGRLAADAMLLFNYEQVAGPLVELISNESAPTQARLNAIHALQMHPDMRVAIELLRLLDDSDGQIVSAAVASLRSLGIEPAADPRGRQHIIEQLRQHGQEAFLRDQLIRQQAYLRRVKAQLAVWQKRYLAALDQIYEAVPEDIAKAKFLAGRLRDSEATVRLWALEKVRQLRLATKTTAKLAEEVGPALVELVGDPEPSVRLKTAALLSLMQEVNCAEKLLAQLEVEQDKQVQTELLVALGGACYYAFLPNSGFKIPAEIRSSTLAWAGKFLAEAEPHRIQTGAEVIRKLLEQDGLRAEEADKYLQLLAERYKQLKDDADGAVRGELVAVMAGLCAPHTAHSASAKQRFGALFEQALSDPADRVREGAVEGLIYIDKAKALEWLRKDFVSDRSPRVRSKLIDLAAEIGDEKDLAWLVGKIIGNNGESEQAWQAVLRIATRIPTAQLSKWVAELTDPGSQAKLSDEQKIAFLEIVERKASGDNAGPLLVSVRERLAELYRRLGQFQKASEYLSRLLEGSSAEKKQTYTVWLLQVYLQWPKPELTAQLVAKVLSEKDLDPNGVVVQAIEAYLSNPPQQADLNSFVAALSAIKVPENRPVWRRCLQQWALRANKNKRAGESKQPVAPKNGNSGS